MRILLNASECAPGGADGAAVVPVRAACMFACAGHDVAIIHPVGTSDAVHGGQAGPEKYSTISYLAPSVERTALLADVRPNSVVVATVKEILSRLEPDVVFDVHGPKWPIEAAMDMAIPVVHRVGDYRWFCPRVFLVDGRLRRCSGPETLRKCYDCLRHGASRTRRTLQAISRLPAGRALIGGLTAAAGAKPADLWHALDESRNYLERLRPRVSRYVIGDQQSFDFFTSHGIAAERICRIPQGLPAGALAQRPRDAARPVVDRPLRVGFVGRMDPDKGFRVLARAVELLPDDAPLELWVVHRTAATNEIVSKQFSSAERFRQMAARRKVVLFRPDSSDELYRLMAQMDVGVIPSIQYENLIVVMLELAAQKTPIVRSESRSMEHVIQDNVNGRTFPYGDSAALARVLGEILARPALLDEWRARLPAIPGDDEYARRLAEAFRSVMKGTSR